MIFHNINVTIPKMIVYFSATLPLRKLGTFALFELPAMAVGDLY